MIISKQDSFITDKEKEQQQRISAETTRLLQLIQDKDTEQLELEKSETATSEQIQKARDEKAQLWKEYNEVQDAFLDLLETIKDRYYNSFKGRENAEELILKDAEDVAAAVSREDCKRHREIWNVRKKMADSAREKIKELKEKGDTRDIKTLELAANQRWTYKSNYEMAVYVVQLALAPQFHAAVVCKVNNAGLVAIAVKRAAELYKKPADRTQHFDVIEINPQDEIDSNFYIQPTSPELELINKALTTSDLNTFEARNKLVNHNQKIKIINRDNKVSITATTDKGSFSIGFGDIEQLTKNNGAVRKMLALSMSKINEQAIHDNKLTKDYIQIPLQELVDNGQYKTIKTARKGFNEAAEVLTNFKAEGKDDKGNSDLIVMFVRATVKKGICYLFPNPYLNWASLMKYYTLIPKYCFRLRVKSFDLLHYISFIARQRTRDISKKGYFTINLRAVQNCLNLPYEVGNKNPERDIKAPIRDAVAEINRADNKQNFVISIVADNSLSIGAYLDKGYLKIKPVGEYAGYFTEIADKTSKKIETAQKKRDTIVQKAKIKALANKIEREE